MEKIGLRFEDMNYSEFDKKLNYVARNYDTISNLEKNRVYSKDFSVEH